MKRPISRRTILADIGKQPEVRNKVPVGPNISSPVSKLQGSHPIILSEAAIERFSTGQLRKRKTCSCGQWAMMVAEHEHEHRGRVCVLEAKGVWGDLTSTRSSKFKAEKKTLNLDVEEGVTNVKICEEEDWYLQTRPYRT